MHLFGKGCGQRSSAEAIPVREKRRKPRHDFAKAHGTLASTSGRRRPARQAGCRRNTGVRCSDHWPIKARMIAGAGIDASGIVGRYFDFRHIASLHSLNLYFLDDGRALSFQPIFSSFRFPSALGFHRCRGCAAMPKGGFLKIYSNHPKRRSAAAKHLSGRENIFIKRKLSKSFARAGDFPQVIENIGIYNL